jgi:hypothetical protein
MDNLEICNSLADYLSQQYGLIDSDAIRVIQSEGRFEQVEHLDHPTTESKLLAAIKKCALNRAPGVDGLGLEFYKRNW